MNQNEVIKPTQQQVTCEASNKRETKKEQSVKSFNISKTFQPIKTDSLSYNMIIDQAEINPQKSSSINKIGKKVANPFESFIHK